MSGWDGESLAVGEAWGEAAATPPPASVYQRADGEHLFYACRINMLFGPSGSAKTMMAGIAAAQELGAGNEVAFFDWEDSREATTERLLQLGVDPSAIDELAYFFKPSSPWGDSSDFAAADGIQRTVKGRHAISRECCQTDGLEYRAPVMTLAIVDAVTDAMAVEGLNPDNAGDVSQFYRGLPAYLARNGPSPNLAGTRALCAVVVIDHTPIGVGGRPIGSQFKIAGLTGAAYAVKKVKPFGRGQTGVSNLVLWKDRLGHIERHTRRSEAAAVVTMVSGDDGQITYSLDVPTKGSDDEGGAELAAHMTRVAALVEAEPGLSKSKIRQAVKGNSGLTDRALDALIRGDLVRTESGARGALLHYRVMPSTEGKEELDPDQD